MRCKPLEPRVMLANVSGTSVALDSVGNIYATGLLYGPADFAPGSDEAWLTAAGPRDVTYPTSDGYLVKYNPDRSVAWAKQLTGDSTQTLNEVVVGADDSIYVVGSTSGNAMFAGHELASGGSAAVVAKLSPQGDVVWVEKLGDSETSSLVSPAGRHIALDGAGKIYVSGSFEHGTGDFDPGPGTYELTAQGYDQYIAKLDCADGSLDWAVQLGASSAVYSGDLAADSTGVYAAAGFAGTIYLGDLSDLTDSGSTTIRDGVLVKLSTAPDNQPHWEWAKQYTDVKNIVAASDGSFVYAAASDDRGAVGIKFSTGHEFVAKYGTDGAEQWFKSWPNGRAYDIEATGGNLYLAGSFGGTVDFNLDPAAQFNLTANGSDDIFVWKMTDAGQLTWAGQMGGPRTATPGEDRAKAIAVDAAGNVFTTGEFVFGTADFDPGPATAALTTLGMRDAFISKLDPNMNYQWSFQVGSYEQYTDDGGPGYQEIGTGWKSSRRYVGYGGDYRYHAKGTGVNKAQWTFSGLAAGTYDVYATWFVDRQNATNAQYTVNGAAAPLINQRISPDDLTVDSTPDPNPTTYWERLGVYAADASGKITVVLSDKANGQVVADAIRVIINTPAGPAAPTASVEDLSLAAMDEILRQYAVLPSILDGDGDDLLTPSRRSRNARATPWDLALADVQLQAIDPRVIDDLAMAVV